ncbi:MAG TPA: class I SAM-dependent methyltransferase, partial [Vicingus sp.]|nr:class I SAM-dependent methyltransferase [Vicingus sp.]
MNKVLEIGCGQGFFSSVLAKKKNTTVVGIDLSKSDIEVAKGRYPQIDFKYMNAEKLKFQDKSFNEVYALDVLEHVDNLEKVVSEVSRVLKKGGIFHINVPAEKSEKWLISIRPTYFKEIH